MEKQKYYKERKNQESSVTRNLNYLWKKIVLFESELVLVKILYILYLHDNH